MGERRVKVETAYLLTMYEHVLAPTQGLVDVLNDVLEVRAEVLALQVENVHAVSFVPLFLQRRQPWYVKYLHKVANIGFPEMRRVENGRDRTEP